MILECKLAPPATLRATVVPTIQLQGALPATACLGGYSQDRSATVWVATTKPHPPSNCVLSVITDVRHALALQPTAPAVTQGWIEFSAATHVLAATVTLKIALACVKNATVHALPVPTVPNV